MKLRAEQRLLNRVPPSWTPKEAHSPTHDCPRGDCPWGSGLRGSSRDTCHLLPELSPRLQPWAPPGPGTPTVAPAGVRLRGEASRAVTSGSEWENTQGSPYVATPNPRPALGSGPSPGLQPCWCHPTTNGTGAPSPVSPQPPPRRGQCQCRQVLWAQVGRPPCRRNRGHSPKSLVQTAKSTSVSLQGRHGAARRQQRGGSGGPAPRHSGRHPKRHPAGERPAPLPPRNQRQRNLGVQAGG